MKSQLPQLKPRVQLPSIAGKRRAAISSADTGYSFWQVHQYTGVSFNVATEDSNTKDMVFSADGTRMFVVGITTDSVYQYDLTTPFDIGAGSISYSGVSFLVSAQDVNPSALAFSTDGTKMYMAGTSSETLFQYDLITPFDISGGSISYSGVSFVISSQDTDPVGVSFSTDGTKMFVAGQTNNTVFQYDLSTPFDISGGSISYSGVSLLVTAQDSNIFAIDFTKDGTRMYMVGAEFDSLFQYKLATPFDLSAVTFTGAALSLDPENFTPTATRFSSNGNRMFMLGSSAGEVVYQYEI